MAGDRILFVTPYPPTPPLGGGRRRQLEILKVLAAEGPVTLATVSFGPADEQALPGLVPDGVEIVTGRPRRGRLTPRLPLALQWSWSAELAARIAAEHRRSPFRLAVVSHAYAFHYTGALGSVPRIIDAQNIESRIYQQFAALSPGDRARLRRLAGKAGIGFVAAARTSAAIAALEERAWREADAVSCVSAEEQKWVARSAEGTRTVLAPNCVGSPAAYVPARRPATVTFSGSLNYLPNIDAVMRIGQDLAPRLKALAPQVSIVAAGAEPSGALRHFCAEHGVHVVANPPHMADVIGGTVMACPVRMVAGTRLKVLDARDLGLPVVTTSLAAEGLDVSVDPGIVVEDDAGAFAEAVLRFLEAADWPPPVKYPPWSEALRPLAGVVRELS